MTYLNSDSVRNWRFSQPSRKHIRDSIVLELLAAIVVGLSAAKTLSCSNCKRWWGPSCLAHALASGGVNLLGAISGPSPGAVRVSLRRSRA